MDETNPFKAMVAPDGDGEFKPTFTELEEAEMDETNPFKAMVAPDGDGEFKPTFTEFKLD